jgi:threonine dehydrogenase-like Zn-dependent dehydrogenase
MAEMMGTRARRPVLFECVGVPGILQTLMEGSPTGARIVVVGVCMEPDHIEPFVAINKQLELHFVLGYTPEEFAETLHGIAAGEILAHPIVTGHVGLDGVAQAFEDLGNPEAHSKILVLPWDAAA